MSSPLRIVIDCRREQPATSHFAMGETRVVDSPAGAYREAEAKPLARFGYRFQIRHVGWPHVAIIRYPDDKRRFMIIGDGTCYDLSTGVTTGHAWPVSGQMYELRQVFWPRWQDCSLCFMTWGHGEPAAVADIEIQELADDALAPPLPAAVAGAGAGPGRELGVQYEDPCGTAASEGALDKATWVERIITYLKHSGQGLFMYPLVWYHGPQVPSLRAGQLLRLDRRARPEALPALHHQPARSSRCHAPAFRRGGAGVHRLDDAAPPGQPDAEDEHRPGRYPGRGRHPQQPAVERPGPGRHHGLTTIYNVNNSKASWDAGNRFTRRSRVTRGCMARRSLGDLEIPGHPAPIFNPASRGAAGGARLHPGFCRRYARFRSFKGVSLNLWAPTLVWFGSLHAGYDDLTCRLFEQETGVRIPVGPTTPQRFSKRYEFLTFHRRPAWIAWRLPEGA